MNKLLKRTVIAGISSIVSLQACVAAGSAVTKKTVTFQKADWRPYLGVMYSLDSVNMNRDYSAQINSAVSNATDGSLMGVDFFSQKYAYGRDATNNAIDFALGVGKIFPNNFYLGLEGNLYLSNKATFNSNPQEAPGGNIYPGSLVPVNFGSVYSVKPLLDIGVRAGYAVNSRFLPYVKAGIASYRAVSSPMQAILDGDSSMVTDIANNANYDSTFAGLQNAAHQLRTAGTYTTPFIGAGMDFKLAEHIVVRAEYNYSNLTLSRTANVSIDQPLGAPTVVADSQINSNVNTNKTEYDMHKFKLGLVFTL